MSMLWIAVKSYFACSWSAFTYIFQGMPADKPSYWAKGLGFNDLSAPEYADSVAQYKADRSFHRLKDVLVEWADAWPQRAAKLLALGGCLLGVLGFVMGGLVVVLVVWWITA